LFTIDGKRLDDRDSNDVYAAERARLTGSRSPVSRIETTMQRSNAHCGQRWVSRGLIRMSAGCEDASDVWPDLERVL
jgi:hypothetical protein